MTSHRTLAAAGAAVALLPALAAGQGSLSGQGYGYPTGELSTRAIGTGGSLAEFDPASPLNPASLGSWGASPISSAIRQLWGRMAITAQYDPEFRRVTAGGTTQSATLTRVPLIAVSIPAREHFQVGLSATTLLDRTFSTQLPSTAVIDGQTVVGTQSIESRGSIADIRLAAAYNVGTRLSFGLGGHLLTGRNQVVSARTFADTTEFGDVSDSTVVDFTGSAVSAGAEWRIVRGLSVAGSYRRGGSIRAERNDTTLRSATAPDRIGVGVRVDRVTGASFTASYANTRWSNMRGLGVSNFSVNDAPEYSAGAELLGPRLGVSQLLLRLGGRRRTLPFGVGTAEVRETSFAGGISAPFTGGRAVFDLAGQFASRAATGSAVSAKERATTVSIGLTVRP